MKLDKLSEFSHRITVDMTIAEYESLISLAAEELRSPEQVIRWLIKKEAFMRKTSETESATAERWTDFQSIYNREFK